MIEGGRPSAKTPITCSSSSPPALPPSWNACVASHHHHELSLQKLWHDTTMARLHDDAQVVLVPAVVHRLSGVVPEVDRTKPNRVRDIHRLPESVPTHAQVRQRWETEWVGWEFGQFVFGSRQHLQCREVPQEPATVIL